VLDLSMGTLGDRGAKALAGVPGLGSLETLDLRHHFLTDEGLDALSHLEIRVVLGPSLMGAIGELRFVAVGE